MHGHIIIRYKYIYNIFDVLGRSENVICNMIVKWMLDGVHFAIVPTTKWLVWSMCVFVCVPFDACDSCVSVECVFGHFYFLPFWRWRQHVLNCVMQSPLPSTPQPPHAREFTVRIYRLFRELPPKCRANIIVIVVVDVVVVSAIAGYRILRYANMHASTALTHQTKKCALLRIFVYI